MPINYLHLQNCPLMKALHFPMSGILRQQQIEKLKKCLVFLIQISFFTSEYFNLYLSDLQIISVLFSHFNFDFKNFTCTY